jgi:propanol-preferring alcohol dehydrogenase
MSRTMKAAVLYRVGEPLVIEQVPIPEVGYEEVLIQVKASGICHSDLHIMDGSTVRDLPLIIGHECAGVIAEVGEGVKQWKVGDRVAANCHIPCRTCRNCLQGQEIICENKKIIGHHYAGAYAEYVKVPDQILIKLPETIPFEQGAVLTDAVATPYHAISKRAEIRIGESVAVFGIGGLGIHAVQLAKLAGASVVYAVDLDTVAIERAASFGAIPIHAKHVDPVEAIRSYEGDGVDASLEFVGSPITIDQAVRVLRKGGRATICGLSTKPIQTVDPGIFVRGEISLKGAWGATVFEIEKLIALLESNQLDLSGSVTQTISLENVNEGIRILRERIGNPIRIVITF